MVASLKGQEAKTEGTAGLQTGIAAAGGETRLHARSRHRRPPTQLTHVPHHACVTRPRPYARGAADAA